MVTPHIAKENMYLTSGHLPYYADSMYPPMELEGVKYYLKSMNCPHHHKIFAAEQKVIKIFRCDWQNMEHVIAMNKAVNCLG